MATDAPEWPWLAAYPSRVAWDTKFPQRSLVDFFDDSVRRFADRPCLDFLGKTYTYGAVGDLVRRAAKGFAGLGVGPGVRVGLILPNTPYYIICHYAVLRIGGTVVNMNPLYAEK